MTRSGIALTLLVGSIGMLPSAAHAAGQWSPIGPDGGRTIAVVNDPVTVTTSYAWTGAGFYKTIDGGDEWTLLGADLFLRVPAISPANPNVIYAVGGTFGVAALDGVYTPSSGPFATTIVPASRPDAVFPEIGTRAVVCLAPICTSGECPVRSRANGLTAGR